jgi:hypothetical protein
MIQVSPDSLLNFMRKNQYDAQFQPETKQVYTILKISDVEFPLFLRIFDDGHLLQLLVFIPCQLQKEVIPEWMKWQGSFSTV